MRHFLSIADLEPREAHFLLAEALRLRDQHQADPRGQASALPGMVLAMIFEKPSLRTRLSFDVGMHQLGGHALYLSPAEIGLGSRESVADVARVVGGMTGGIVARVFQHSTLTELAKWSPVPVINGLSDQEHPCQALADLLTLKECCGLEGKKLAYLGDGNNVCNSLMLLCAKLGVEFVAATPPEYPPDEHYVKLAGTWGQVSVTHSPEEAVTGAHAVYTDVWTSMGQEAEAAQRQKAFPPYQVNERLMALAAPDAIVLHCLPAHRGEEITEGVLESPQSRVFLQAQNRLHAQKAVLAWLL